MQKQLKILVRSVVSLYLIARPLLIVAACATLVVGMVASRSLMSIAMLTLAGTFLLNPNLLEDWKTFFSDKSLLAFWLLFFLILISGFWSEDHGYFLERVRIKLPFLAMPVVMIPIRKLPRSVFHGLLYLFIGLMLIMSVGVLISYLYHYEAVTASFRWGHGIPMPMNHIRFSLLIVISIICALWLFEKNIRWLGNSERWIIPAVIIFQIVMLHVFAVRSGLSALYVFAVIYGLFLFFNKKKPVLGIALVLLAGSAPIIAYSYVESFKNKIDYTKYDLEMFFNDQVYEGLSDSKRIISIQTGIEIGNEHPIGGTGAGDLLHEMNQKYQEIGMDYKNTIPHNQWVFFYAELGWLALLAALGILLPFFLHLRPDFWPLLAIYLVFLVSFMAEATIEAQLGTAIYTFFLLLFINYFAPRNSTHENFGTGNHP